MPIYAYTGLTAQGRAIAGVIDADSPKGARLSLRRTGIFPTTISAERAAQTSSPAGTTSGLTRLFERVPARELALLTRQLATLTKAGLPLVECLSTLIEQMEHAALKRVLSHVRQQVREGRSLADALQAHPRVFSSIYINMVRAGEESGTLETVLARLADYSEDQARLLRTVQSALTYPLLMVVVASAILLFLLAYVVPQVTRIFSDTGQKLPLVTRLLIGLSSFLADYWWLLLVVGASGMLGGHRVGFVVQLETTEIIPGKKMKNLCGVAADVDSRENSLPSQFLDDPLLIGPGKPIEHLGGDDVGSGQTIPQGCEMSTGPNQRVVDGQMALVAQFEQLGDRRVVGLRGKIHQEFLNAADQASQAESHLIRVPADSQFATRLLGHDADGFEQDGNASIRLGVDDLEAIHFRQAADGRCNDSTGFTRSALRRRPHGLR